MRAPIFDKFLSIQAQDFIEDKLVVMTATMTMSKFLSIQAQDFIEEDVHGAGVKDDAIPEHSSSGLH